jgi:hypothetical protein
VFGAAVVALALPVTTLAAQTSIEDAIRQLNSANGKGYLQPLADLFAADMSSGWYHGANIRRNGFSFGIELVAATSVVEDKHKVYTAQAPAGFNPSTFETATVLGGTGSTATGPNGTEYRGSDGMVLADYIPTAVPQLRLGIAGTELVVRYMSSNLVSALPEDFPETNLLGAGLRHNVSQYFGAEFPVDISLGVFYSSIELGAGADEGVSAKYTGIGGGLQASKTFSVFTIFLGATSDGGTMTLEYQSTDPDEAGDVSVDLDIERKIKFGAGAALKLGPITIFGDASFGPATTYSGGLRIGS